MKPWTHIVRETMDNAFPLYMDWCLRAARARSDSPPNVGTNFPPALLAKRRMEWHADHLPPPPALQAALDNAIDFDFSDVPIHKEDAERGNDRIKRGVFRIPFEYTAVLALQTEPDEKGYVWSGPSGTIPCYRVLHQDPATHTITCFVFADLYNGTETIAYFPTGIATLQTDGSQETQILLSEKRTLEMYGTLDNAHEQIRRSLIGSLGHIASLECSSLDKIPGPPPTKLNKNRQRKGLPLIRPRYGVKIKLGAKHEGTPWQGGTHDTRAYRLHRANLSKIADVQTSV